MSSPLKTPEYDTISDAECSVNAACNVIAAVANQKGLKLPQIHNKH